jgi:hypothetical protein
MLGDTLSRKLTLRRNSVLASLDPRYELKGQNVGGHTVLETHSTHRFSPGSLDPRYELKGQNVGGHIVPETYSTHGDSVLASLDPRYELKGQNVGGHTVPATYSTQRFSPGLIGPQVRVKGTKRGNRLSGQLTLLSDSVLASLVPGFELMG